jgi:amidase
MAHSLLASLTGHPAVVLPLVQSSEGLPIGVQVIGRLWEDMALLNVAEALTEVTGPFRRPRGY